jgi:anthranilate synthase component 2
MSDGLQTTTCAPKSQSKAGLLRFGSSEIEIAIGIEIERLRFPIPILISIWILPTIMITLAKKAPAFHRPNKLSYAIGKTATQTHVGWLFFLEVRMALLVAIDNYDSFTFNLVQMFKPYPLEISVFRSDKVTVDALADLRPDYLLISPGPKDPAHAGISCAAIRRFFREIPILGVCLGMQSINEVFGGRTVRSPQPLHGKTSAVFHEGHGLFKGMPSPFQAARYHSLVTAPDETALTRDLVITARTTDGLIMGLAHRRWPLNGVQFHPESFLTEQGERLIANFLALGPFDTSRPLVATSALAGLEVADAECLSA